MGLEKDFHREYHESMGNKEPGRYKALGSKIKSLREQWNQSLSEVSGTLEIEEQTLRAIEEGKALPHDELLDMLISHFLLTEEQAVELRQMADSQKQPGIEGPSGGLEDALMKQIAILMPADNKVIYTDGMQATVNDNGVILHFLQQQKPGGKQIPISRVGMSREHAERMIKVLQDTLKEHDGGRRPRMLPRPEEQ